MLNQSNFATLIQEQAEKYGDVRALSYRDYEQDKWVEISWKFQLIIFHYSHHYYQLL